MAGATAAAATPIPTINLQEFWRLQAKIDRFPEPFWLDTQLPAPRRIDMGRELRALDEVRMYALKAGERWYRDRGDSWRALEREVWQLQERMRAPDGPVKMMQELEEVVEGRWRLLLHLILHWQWHAGADEEGGMRPHCLLMLLAACQLLCVAAMVRRHVVVRAAKIVHEELPILRDCMLYAAGGSSVIGVPQSPSPAIRRRLDNIIQNVDLMTGFLRAVREYWYSLLRGFPELFMDPEAEQAT